MIGTNRTKFFYVSFLVLIYLFISFSPSNGQDVNDSDSIMLLKPVPDTAAGELMAVGKNLYSKHCALCHGKRGMGDGPKAADLDISFGDFTLPEFKEKSPSLIAHEIEHGRGEMPAFGKTISDEEVAAVTAYILTFKEDSHSAGRHNTHSRHHEKKFKYFLSGDLFTGIGYDESIEDGEKFHMVATGIAPILIWKISKRLMYEGELAVLFSGNEGFKNRESAEVAVEYSNLGFILNDFMIIRAGTFYSTTGVYEDWHQQFITNKFTSRPLGIGRAGTEPSTDIGINFRGVIPIAKSKLNYSLFLSNGEMLNMEDHESVIGKEEEKKIRYDRFEDHDFNKAVSGRIGFLPFYNSSLEAGISSQFATGHDENSIYENTKSIFSGIDINYLKDIDEIRGSVHFWSAYFYLDADQHELKAHDSLFVKLYDEKSSSYAWFAQLSYRPTEILNKFLRKCELAARFSVVDFLRANDLREDKSQIAFALNYWIHWNSVIKVSYEQEMVHQKPQPGRFISTIAFVF